MEAHSTPSSEENLPASCNNCDKTFESLDDLKKHSFEEHVTRDKMITVKQEYFDHITLENKTLKLEMAKLKEDFEKLHEIFETSKNAANKDNIDVDVELSNLREKFRVTKTENEFLKEKDETLFKLGKIALDNKKTKEPEIEIVEDGDEDGLDVLVQSVIDNKNSGFRRVGPATYADKVNKEDSKNNATENATKPKINTANQDNSANIPRNHINVKYCHFFSNFGECDHEVRTGFKCRYSHKKAPNCKYDGNCNRMKCMFTHIKQMTPPGYLPPQPLPQQMPSASFLRNGFRHPGSPWQGAGNSWMLSPQHQQMWQMAGNRAGF